MRSGIRIIVIMLVAAVVVTTVVNGVAATVMAANMALAGQNGIDLSDCPDCPGGNDNGSTCGFVCVTPLLAMVDAIAPAPHPVNEVIRWNAAIQAVGRTGLPEPYPPRNVILN